MGKFKKAVKRANMQRKKARQRQRSTQRQGRHAGLPLHHCRILASPFKKFWRIIKRIIFVSSALLFCGFAYAAYTRLHGSLASRPGRALTWSAGAALAPVAAALPWWVWVGLAGLAVYLWVKHTLVMSIVYGVLTGMYLAL